MQRIWQQKLLIAAGLFSALAIAGCQKQASKTVGDYLHDYDATRAYIDSLKNKPRREYENDPDFSEASYALSRVQFIRKCWAPNAPVSTATTDHACLDANGFTRSK